MNDAVTKEDKRAQTINRTPNPECPACVAMRMHKPEEWAQFHPRAGSGRIHDVEVGK